MKKHDTKDSKNNDVNVEDDVAPTGAEAADQLAAVIAERDALRVERDETKDLLVRRQAEFDNFRRRTEKERSEFLQYSGMELVRDMLPILDDFERAFKVEGAPAEYVKGFEMIYNRTYETLKKLGLEPIETAGQMFDPHLHQAVERVGATDATAGAEEGAIVGEFQRGYNFKGRLLRPSMVRVRA